MAYVPKGDVIALDDQKAGALVHSTSLAAFSRTSTDPVRMFARRDAFRTVAEAIASGIAGVPFNLYQRDEANGRRKLGAEDHRVAAALESPHAGITPYRFTEALMLDHVLHDRWACMIDQLEDGSVELVRLPAKYISFVVDALFRVTHVAIYGKAREPLLVPIKFVAFDVGYDPNPSGSETRGFPLSHTLEASATELEKGAAYRDAILAGGPKVPMYITRPVGAPEWIKSGGRTRFTETFKAYSTEKAGEVPLLEDGMELKSAPQLPIQDVQYRETRLAAQIEFAIAMHFPPELVGYRAGNFSNIEALREQLYIDTLGGRITAFRQALNAGLRRALLLLGGYYVEENLGARLASTPEKQASLLQTQVGAPVRTVNEARRMLNLPPVPGGDELIVPLNVIRGGLASPTDTGPKAITAGLQKGRLGTPPQYKAAVEKQREKFAAALAKTLAAQAARVSAGLGDGDSPGSLDDAFDLERENAELTATIYPHSVALAAAGAAVVLDRYNPKREGFSEEVMLPWLLKAAGGTANQMNQGTFGRLAGTLFGDDWKAGIANVLGQLSTSDAELWAQTVATASTSFGSQDAAKASGLTQKTWIHNGAGPNSRAEHAALNGETVGAGDLFSNGGRWPGDPVLGADENANCHCTVEWSRIES